MTKCEKIINELDELGFIKMMPIINNPRNISSQLKYRLVVDQNGCVISIHFYLGKIKDFTGYVYLFCYDARMDKFFRLPKRVEIQEMPIQNMILLYGNQ